MVVIRTDADNRPIENPNPPLCEHTPCKSYTAKPCTCGHTICTCGSSLGKPRMLPLYWDIYDLYRQAATFKCLPKSGGLQDQDPLMMRLLCEIGRIVDAAEGKAKVDLARQVGPFGAFFAMSMFGNKR